MLPEAAEAHLPLKPTKANADAQENPRLALEGQPPAEPPLHIVPPAAQLNGSVKVPPLESVEVEDEIKVDGTSPGGVEEYEYDLCRWPSERGKFTKVRIFFTY